MAVLGRSDIPPERQSREIWLAATADRGEKLLNDYSHHALAKACKLVAEGRPVNEGLLQYEKATRYESESGFALELGRRALIRSLARRKSTTDFVGELFSEAISYYASRDLPSFVAAKGCITNASESIKLKDQFRRLTKTTVKSLGEPKYDERHWRPYVAKVLDALRGQKDKK
jgi:hypothetical protein